MSKIRKTFDWWRSKVGSWRNNIRNSEKRVCVNCGKSYFFYKKDKRTVKEDYCCFDCFLEKEDT